MTSGQATVKVLPTDDPWFGVTYRADKSIATACIRKLIDAGVYPERLWAPVMKYDLPFLARQFRTRGEPREIAPVPVGHINDTYVVTTASNRYVLQRINQIVFTKPVQVMANIVRITEHIRAKMAAADPASASRQLEVIPTKDGGGYYRDAGGQCLADVQLHREMRSPTTLSNPQPWLARRRGCSAGSREC